MKTQILKPSFENLNFCADLLKKDEIVAVPTETVYGLAANASSDFAVSKIFKAKGRPQDNPLICHVNSFEMFYSLTSDNSVEIKNLIEAFWPGPLTVVVEKKAGSGLSKVATAGLNTVGVRFSSNGVLNKLIGLCGFALAAPSANLSKKPSSTCVNHVVNDFNGKIPAILDGGVCNIGVESTVVKFEKGCCVVLRPGFITVEMLKAKVNDVRISEGVLNLVNEKKPVESPGIKYKHYSPNADVVLVKGTLAEFVNYVKDKLEHDTYCVVFDGEQKYFKKYVLSYGKTGMEQARNLFHVLRKIDELKLKKVFFRCPEETGVSMAVLNRLIRAAEFDVIYL